MVYREIGGSLQNLGSVSGTDATPIGMVSGTRAQRFFIENPLAILHTATGISSFVGAGEVFITQEGSVITVSGTPHGTGFTLQDGYDNGSGVIQTTTGKPVVISGIPTEEDFRVVGSGTFTEALTVGEGTTYLNAHAITTASGVFSTSLTISGVPVSNVAPDVFHSELVSASGHLQTQIDVLGGAGGGGPEVPEGDPLAVQIDEVPASGITYIGEAAPGSPVTSGVWRLKRMDEIGDDLTVTWAGGNALFNKAWTARFNFTYS